MISNDIKKDLEATSGDLVAAGIKGLASQVPFVSELLDIIFTSPVEKRKEEWLIYLAEGLEELRNKVGEQSLESLKDNELFTTIVLDATSIAMKTHQELKRQALRNACLNCAEGTKLNEDIQLIFTKNIDSLTNLDLQLLIYFENPIKRFEENGECVDTSFGNGSVTDGLYRYYPKIKGQDEIISNRIKTLYNLGFVSISDIGGTMSLNGVYSPRLTNMGKQFVSFIRE
ncbi:MAG: hypothetical protein RR942_06600 [Romboutsia sp.]